MAVNQNKFMVTLKEFISPDFDCKNISREKYTAVAVLLHELWLWDNKIWQDTIRYNLKIGIYSDLSNYGNHTLSAGVAAHLFKNNFNENTIVLFIHDPHSMKPRIQYFKRISHFIEDSHIPKRYSEFKFNSSSSSNNSSNAIDMSNYVSPLNKCNINNPANLDDTDKSNIKQTDNLLNESDKDLVTTPDTYTADFRLVKEYQSEDDISIDMLNLGKYTIKDNISADDLITNLLLELELFLSSNNLPEDHKIYVINNGNLNKHFQSADVLERSLLEKSLNKIYSKIPNLTNFYDSSFFFNKRKTNFFIKKGLLQLSAGQSDIGNFIGYLTLKDDKCYLSIIDNEDSNNLYINEISSFSAALSNKKFPILLNNSEDSSFIDKFLKLINNISDPVLTFNHTPVTFDSFNSFNLNGKINNKGAKDKDFKCNNLDHKDKESIESKENKVNIDKEDRVNLHVSKDKNKQEEQDSLDLLLGNIDLDNKSKSVFLRSTSKTLSDCFPMVEKD